MSDIDDDIDWSKTTFEGSRREQLRRWCALALQQRLEALDGMLDLAKRLRRRRPTGGEPGTPVSTDTVREHPPRYGTGSTLRPIVLRGCTPQPLGNYLKALGVFRLVAEQADPAARGWWSGGVFHLSSQRFANAEALAAWLFCECELSPFVAPWQTGVGYLPMGSREKGAAALRSLLTSERKSLRRVKNAFKEFATEAGVDLATVEPSEWVATVAQSATTDGPTKRLLQEIDNGQEGEARVHRMLRNTAREDTALEWLDAVGSVRSDEDREEVRWFGLLANGGGEASGQYVVNLQQRLVEKLLFGTAEEANASRDQMLAALTGKQWLGVLEANKMGAMYYPALIKGFNSGQTFASKPDRRVNPWDFILLLEGTLLWASATTRRLMNRQLASFPFFCRSSLGGAGTLVTSEADGSPGSPTRGELWCPLWNTPASIATLRALFSEGRLQLGERTCASALEFARAVARFGLERGISAFTRFGLIERSGSGKQRTLLAVPLGRWSPRRLPHIELLDELDAFTDEVADRLQHHDNQPRRLLIARARMERAVFDVASQPLGGRDDQPQNLLNVLTETAVLERELAVRRGSVKIKVGQRLMERRLNPVPPLSLGWIKATDNRSIEFRLAHAVASIASWGDGRADTRERSVGPLRTNLLPLRYDNGRWKWDEQSRSAVWSRAAGLFDNLAGVLRRRLIDASRVTGKGLPLWSSNGAGFEDLLKLWQGDIDKQRIEDLIHALTLVDFSAKESASEEDNTDASGRARSGDTAGEYQAQIDAAAALPRAYALLKLCFLGGRLPPRPTAGGLARRTREEEFPPHAPEILNLLLAGRLREALDTASGKLRAKGYPSVVPESAFRNGEFSMTATETRRLAGLLLVPVRRPSILVRLAIRPVPKR